LVSDSGIPTVGASGAIMGVLVAFGMSFPNRPVLMFPLFIPIPAKFFVMIYAAIDLFSGLSSTNSGVAHFAHLGGALTGFLLIKFGSRLLDRSEQFTRGIEDRVREQKSASNVHVARFRDLDTQQPASPQMFHGASFFYQGEYITQERVDEILERISRSGYESLSQNEKEILAEVSRRMS
jgi:hypothetical protein